ncbi:MAG: SMC-Scp complex subunit ScpB [Candidatus Woesearchaeota archaeon]
MADNKIIKKVEAVLFASGKPLDSGTVMDVIEESSKKRVNNALKKLKKIYDERDCSLMVLEQDGHWKFTVREEFLPIVRKIVSDTELPKAVLETLAVIAWKSPVIQSDVIKVRTNKAYEHIDQLEKLGFINKKKEGRSYRISLSEKFFEYFDVKNGDIRTMFKDSSGIEKELEIEQKRRNGEDEENRQDTKKDEIEKAIEAEKPHLGELEVVDAITKEYPQSIQIVDAIETDNADEREENKDAEEIIEEIDEDEKAKEEFDELEKEAISRDD